MALFSRIPFNKKEIEAAIVRLEQQTSAELRVYIERYIPKLSKSHTAMSRALSVFEELNMSETQARNGVLIYIAYKDHQCAIISDEGIHQYVDNNFWQAQCDEMTHDFKQKAYTQGVVKVIENITTVLAEHFPIQLSDRNELDNEVIIHD